MKETTIKTANSRTLTVSDYGPNKYLRVRDTGNNNQINSYLSDEDANKLAGGLLGDNVAVIMGLPEAKQDEYGYVAAGPVWQYEPSNPEDLEDRAKGLLAIAKFIRKAHAEKEAAEAAEKAKEVEAEKVRLEEQAKLTERRDKIAEDLSGIPGYYGRTTTLKNAIDRIIELEDAVAKKTPTAASVFGL